MKEQNKKEILKNLEANQAILNDALEKQDARKVLEASRKVIRDGMKDGYLDIEKSDKEDEPQDPFKLTGDGIWDMMPQEIKDYFTYPENSQDLNNQKITESISSWILEAGKNLLNWLKEKSEDLKKEMTKVGELLHKPLRAKDVTLPLSMLVAIIAINPDGSLQAARSLSKDLTNLKGYYQDGLHVQKAVYHAGKSYTKTFKNNVLPAVKQDMQGYLQQM
jgi:hypothetical protein